MEYASKFGNFMRNTGTTVATTWQGRSTLTKACVIGTAAAVGAPLAIIPVLSAAGFTSAGVAAGSIAAYVQTATTASGGFFALCQSAGAVGAVATTTSVGVGLGAGATVGGVTAVVCRQTGPSQNSQGEGPSQNNQGEGPSQNNQEEEETVAVQEEDAQSVRDEPHSLSQLQIGIQVLS